MQNDNNSQQPVYDPVVREQTNPAIISNPGQQGAVSSTSVNIPVKPSSNRLPKALKICIILQLIILVVSLLYAHFAGNGDNEQYILFPLWIFAGFTIAVVVLLLAILLTKKVSYVSQLTWVGLLNI
jgi:hypothetical protein